MNKKLIYSIIGVTIFFLLIFGIYCATTIQDKKIKQLERQVVYLKEEIVPIRFKILERKNDSIFFSLKFYDMDQHLIHFYDEETGEKKEFIRIKMPGQELALDFIVVPIGNRFLAFPYKVLSDAIAPKDGIILFKYYYRDNFPQIYYSMYNSPAFNAGVKALFEKIIKGDIQDIKNIFGSLVQDVQNIKQFEIGYIYRVVFHPAKGGIEIIQE